MTATNTMPWLLGETFALAALFSCRMMIERSCLQLSDAGLVLEVPSLTAPAGLRRCYYSMGSGRQKVGRGFRQRAISLLLLRAEK